MERSSLRRVGIVAADVALAAAAVGVLGWTLRRFGPRGWRVELDVVIVTALVIAGIGWLVSLLARLRLSK